MSIPMSNPATGRGTPGAAALDLLAAAGNALTPGHVPDAATGPATGAGFLALVQQALGVQQPGAGCPIPDATDAAPDSRPDAAPDSDPDSDPDVEPVERDPKPTPVPTVLDPIYAALVANFSPLPSSLPGPMTTPANSAPVHATGTPLSDVERVETEPQPTSMHPPDVPSASDDSSVSTGSTSGTTSSTAAGAAFITTSDDRSVSTGSTSGTTSSTAAGAAADDRSVSTGSTSGTASGTAPDTASSTTSDDSSVSTGSTSGTTSGTAPDTASSTTSDDSSVSTGSTSGTAPVAPSAVVAVEAGSSTSASNPVNTQIVDRITSLITTNGTHRITLDLTPGDLGQVRVVMTVRDGAVHVRLAAGERDTRAALVEGSAELKSLLGLAGATDARITVRELGNAFGTQLQNQSPQPQNQPQNQQHAQQHAQEQAQQHAQGGQGWGHQDQHAGTRATYEPATDGTTSSHRDSGAGATGTRSSETVPSNRNTGLDVTM